MKQRRRLVLVEVLFVALVLVLAYLYGSQPARKDSWARILDEWSLKEAFSDGARAPVAPFDWSSVDLYGLARFGNELEFLGCDVAITHGESGAHVWQVTIWRALAPLERDYTIYMHFVRPGDAAPFFAQADHLLGQQFPGGIIPTSQWEPGATMLDAILLPDEVQSEAGAETHIGVWVPESGVDLATKSDVLEVDEHGRLVICQ